METTRQQKIAKQIQRDMAEIFQKEGAEIVRGVLVTVTAVRVSPDFHTPRSTSASFPSNRMPLSWPRWSSTIGSCAGHWVSGFGTASRRSPEIQFFLDDSLEYIEQIDRAMHREE